MVTQQEIVERWLGGSAVNVGLDRLSASFDRVERMLGRSWLDHSLSSGSVGAAIALPLHVLGEHLAVLDRAIGNHKLLARLSAGDRAASSELHAAALCVPSDRTEIEIEPEITVGSGPRIPDFRVRMPDEPWVHVEVTAPTSSETALAAQRTAVQLANTARLREGVTIQIRFRREPLAEDLEIARRDMNELAVGSDVDRTAFVMHAMLAEPEVSPIGNDENGRPIYGCLKGLVDGDKRSMIVVRVPYTDQRAQAVLDAEAKQLPKEGPGLVCIRTTYGDYWRGLIERSYSPTIRRRISAALLFESAIRPGENGYHLPSIGQLVVNPHARTPLPGWLRAHLEALPHKY